MADAPPEIRTQPAIALLLLLLAAIGLPLTGLMLLGASAKPVGLLPGEPRIAIAFGAGMAIAFGIAHFVRSRWVARSFGFDLPLLVVPRVSQTVEVIVPANPARARAAVVNALRAAGNQQPIADPEQRVFSTSTRISWASWGERLEVQVQPVDEQRCLLVMSSRSRLPTTLVDFGVSVRNVARLLRAVEADLAGRAPAA